MGVLLTRVVYEEDAEKERSKVEKLLLGSAVRAEKEIRAICGEMGRKLASDTDAVCPVEFTASLLRLLQSRSCGKCVPCRIGLGELADLLDQVLDGAGQAETLEQIERVSRTVSMSADCAIGQEAARMLQVMLPAFRADFLSHLEHGRCTAQTRAVPCVSGCPAHVDIPGYIALTKAGRYADAVRQIRKDNPFPSVCGLVCEHPCEAHCRRNGVDDAVNIRGLKRYAVDHAGLVPAPKSLPSTGKKVAIVGAGPSGLTAAYYLSLMGHKADVYERRKRTGGMLRYGIPCYRLPDAYLDLDINAILSTGVTVKTGVDIGTDIPIQKLREEYDCVYIAIGAHTDKKLGIPNEGARGVMSAVEFLGHIGDGGTFDFAGKNVVIVGGGNVAMDATRTSMRLGAKSVKCVYRRRIEDMTALPEEVEGAVAEGCEVIPLMAPARVEVNTQEDVVGLWVQPQMIGMVQRGRPAPRKANKPEELIAADVIIVAIGQDIEIAPFEAAGIPVERAWFKADRACAVPGEEGLFVGGDCESGPATVIRAVEAGKVAAANIDRYLGYNTQLDLGVEIPAASVWITGPCGRVNMTEESALVRKDTFCLMERSMSNEEALQECSRCLRCDHYGKGAFCGGRTQTW